MNNAVRFQLSLMMFLEFFIWGSWYVTMGTYLLETLKATGLQTGAAYGANSIATMISPFLVGMIADRYFSAQRFMGVLHLIGAGLLYLCTQIKDPGLFFWIILAYSAVYMPTIALSNSVAFSQMTEPDKQFPNIRVWGTVGWICTGLLIGALHLEGVANIATTEVPFLIAAGASLLLGLFSFILPDTPPKAAKSSSVAQVLGLDSMVLFKDRSYLVFFVSAVLVCIPLSFYYSFTNAFLTNVGMENATGKMTMGQMSEALFMLLIPVLFVRWGVKNILLVAMLAWLARFVFFSFGDMGINSWMLYAGIILHGVCYDFFFVTGFIYTETKSGPAIKNAAQGLITFATYGLGMFIGSNLSGMVADAYRKEGVIDWQPFWLVPAGVTLAVLVFFLLLFREKQSQSQPVSELKVQPKAS
jgi:nucleoside transporter